MKCFADSIDFRVLSKCLAGYLLEAQANNTFEKSVASFSRASSASISSSTIMTGEVTQYGVMYVFDRLMLNTEASSCKSEIEGDELERGLENQLSRNA